MAVCTFFGFVSPPGSYPDCVPGVISDKQAAFSFQSNERERAVREGAVGPCGFL